MRECGFEKLPCNFAGKCDGTYLRGTGREPHDRESAHVPLNIAMSLIDEQARTIEQQTRKIDVQARTMEQQTVRMNELASTKLHLEGTDSGRYRQGDRRRYI
jgi:hypothetical protein